MKLLGSTRSKITKNENSENVPHLEIAEIIWIHCNIANKNYLQDSRVLHKFVPNKLFGKLLDILPENFIFFKTFEFRIQNFHVLQRILKRIMTFDDNMMLTETLRLT